MLFPLTVMIFWTVLTVYLDRIAVVDEPTQPAESWEK